MFCMNCGSSLPDGTKFCHNCGAPQQSAEAAAPAQQPSPVQAQPEQPVVQPAQPEVQPAQSEAQPAAPKIEKTIELPKIRPPKFTEVSRDALKSKQENPDSRVTERIEVPPEMPPVMAAPAPQCAPQPTVKPKAGSTKRNVIILVVVLVLLIAGAVTALFATGTIGGKNPDKLLETAEKYLDEKDYEQAIIQFEKLLEIDPYNVDAYLGMAEALTALDRADEAQELLNEAADKIKDEDDLKKIGEAIIKVQLPEESEEHPAPTDESTATDEAPEVTTLPSSPTAEALPVTQEAEQTEDAAQTAEAAETVETTEAASGETAESAATPESTQTEIVYGDPEVLAIEQMLKAHLEGNGELDTSVLSEITEFRYYYEKYVCVVMGNRGGTYLDLKSVNYSPFDSSNYTLSMNNGTYDYYTQVIDYNNITDPSEAKLYGKFKDISFVEYMPKLRKFVSCGSVVSDLSALTKLEALEEVELYLWYSRFDLSVFTEMKSLKRLTLSRAGSNDKSALNQLTQLEKLCLGSFDSTDGIDLTAFTALKELSCGGDDLSIFANNTQLEKLCVHAEVNGPVGSATADAAALLQLKNLKELKLTGYAEIDNLNMLAELPQLTSLTLSTCGLTDLSVLEVLTNLKKLEIIQYDITDAQIAALQAKLPDCEITKGN